MAGCCHVALVLTTYCVLDSKYSYEKVCLVKEKL